MTPVIMTFLIATTLGCNRKDTQASFAAVAHEVTIESMANFAFLQEIEAEDPYLAAALTEDDVEQETAQRAEAIKRQADANQDGKIDPEEQARLKSQVADKMLELFDVDSDGAFSEAERNAIREKIHARIESSKNRTNSSKS